MSALGEHREFDDNGLIEGKLPSLVAAAQELKSPLALVRQLSLSLQDDDLAHSEKLRIYKQISLTSERALRLTNDLTKSVKLSDGLFKLEPINPVQLCEDVVRELTPLFSAYNRNVKLVSRRRPMLLVANRDLLKSIVTCFSDNALRCVEDESAVEIKLGLSNKGKTVRLEVRDYGPSLPKNTLSNINSRIAKSSLTKIDARPNNSGLGLYMANLFADAMNGKIGIKRHQDGSTFYIDLQASQQLSLL